MRQEMQNTLELELTICLSGLLGWMRQSPKLPLVGLLTKREIEFAQAFLELDGSIPEIAEALGVSTLTAKTFLDNVSKKLNIQGSNRKVGLFKQLLSYGLT